MLLVGELSVVVDGHHTSGIDGVKQGGDMLDVFLRILSVPSFLFA